MTPPVDIAGCSDWAGSDNVQYRAGYAVAEAQVLLGEGKAREALEAARRALDEVMSGGLSVAHEVVRIGFPIALEAAIDAGEIEDADRLAAMLAGRPRARCPRSCVHRSPTQGRSLPVPQGDDEAVEENLVSAEGTSASSATPPGRRRSSSTAPSGSPARGASKSRSGWRPKPARQRRRSAWRRCSPAAGAARA